MHIFSIFLFFYNIFSIRQVFDEGILLCGFMHNEFRVRVRQIIPNLDNGIIDVYSCINIINIGLQMVQKICM